MFMSLFLPALLPFHDADLGPQSSPRCVMQSPVLSLAPLPDVPMPASLRPLTTQSLCSPTILAVAQHWHVKKRSVYLPEELMSFWVSFFGQWKGVSSDPDFFRDWLPSQMPLFPMPSPPQSVSNSGGILEFPRELMPSPSATESSVCCEKLQGVVMGCSVGTTTENVR